MPRHIGIVGLRHSGKTTLAKAFLSQGGYAKRALADPLKDSAVEMCNTFLTKYNRPLITREDIEKDKAQFRLMLQWLGTEFAREYVGPDDFWIRLFQQKVEEAEKWGLAVVCDDVRFPNEAKRLRELGFLIVKVIRDETDRQASLQAAGDVGANHSSETSVDLIDADVYLNKVPQDKMGEVVAYLVDMNNTNRFKPKFPMTIKATTGDTLLAFLPEVVRAA
jgi:hypothetical protein